MIIIRLVGGLGNQLFQYAFGRSLSYNLDTELFLDVSYFSHYTRPKHIIFGLHSFNIKGLVGYYPYVEKTSIGINYTAEHDLLRYVEGFPFPDKIHDYKVIENLDIVLPTYFQGWYQNQIDDGKNSIITENFFKINGFVEILSDFYKKFFKNIFLFYFYFNFQRIILESVFLFYT